MRRANFQTPLNDGAFESVAAHARLALSTVVAAGIKDLAVQFIVSRIVIKLVSEDTWVVASLAGNVCGYDEGTVDFGHIRPFRCQRSVISRLQVPWIGD
jgi:hypothetical protein